MLRGEILLFIGMRVIERVDKQIFIMKYVFYQGIILPDIFTFLVRE